MDTFSMNDRAVADKIKRIATGFGCTTDEKMIKK